MPYDEKPKLDYASARKSAKLDWAKWLDRVALIVAGFIVMVFFIAIAGGCVTGFIFWMFSRRGG